MRYTLFDTPVLSWVVRRLAVGYLRVSGWTMEGKIPDSPKWVMIAAPHTSNWDFPVMLSVAFALDVKLSWLGKSTLFKWPFGAFFRYLGGIPVNRSRSEKMCSKWARMWPQGPSSSRRAIGCAPRT